MFTLCWAAKGGSGTTVVATALALTATPPSLLVDLDGEVPAVLGMPVPDRPGVADWLATDSSADRLGELLVEVGTGTWLLPWQSSGRTPAELPLTASRRWDDLGPWLAAFARDRRAHITVDAGTGSPPRALVAHADRTLLVTRPCYLALRRAVAMGVPTSGIVLVDEPGRALSARDVEHAIGAPIHASVSIDPAVARAVDAGLLSTRLPRLITRELGKSAA